jgi:hypothetical protein
MPPPSPIRMLLVDHQALLRAGMRLLRAAQPDLDVVGEAPDSRIALATARADLIGQAHASGLLTSEMFYGERDKMAVQSVGALGLVAGPLCQGFPDVRRYFEQFPRQTPHPCLCYKRVQITKVEDFAQLAIAFAQHTIRIATASTKGGAAYPPPYLSPQQGQESGPRGGSVPAA